jgi:hypothetical protein
VPIVLKSGSLNLLEPSGPVQACNGIALPLLKLEVDDDDNDDNNYDDNNNNNNSFICKPPFVHGVLLYPDISV